MFQMRQQIAPSKDHNAISLVRTMAKPLQLSLNAHIVTAALHKGMKPPVGRRVAEWKTRILAISTFPLPANSDQAAQPPFSGQGAALDSSRPQKRG